VRRRGVGPGVDQRLERGALLGHGIERVQQVPRRPRVRLPPLLSGSTILTKPSAAADLITAVRGAARSQSNVTEGSL
jgi:hypothetical protein